MLNEVVLMGRLTKDPELRFTSNNVPVTSFTIAVDRGVVNRETQRREADFFNCVAWRAAAEIVNKYFTKGNRILLNGRLQNSDWTDNNGNKRYTTEVVVDRVYFIENKKENAPEIEPEDYSELKDDDVEFPF